MLDSTSASVLKASPPVSRITGNYLAKNRLSTEARIAIAVRIARGDEAVFGLTLSQICRLCRVPRGSVDRQLGRHHPIARAFARASAAEQVAFVRLVGTERIWNRLTEAL
jgi:hypothetical protein